MGELAELEVDQDEAAEQAVVEDEVDEEVIAVEADSLLASHETEALAELEQERLEAVDDGLLQVSLPPVRALRQVEELEHERVLDDAPRSGDLLAHARQREDAVLVPALCEALVEEAIWRFSSRTVQPSRAASIS